MTRRLGLAFLFILFFNSFATADILKTLAEKAPQVQTIACTFTQETHMALFDEVVTSHGNFFFKRPQTLRWEYTAPFKSGFIITNGAGKEWDEATGKTRSFTVEQSPQIAIIAKEITTWIHFSLPLLQKQYDIEVDPQRSDHLRLHPKSKLTQKFIAHLDFFFSKDFLAVRQVEIHSPDGDFTRLFFKDHQLNTSLPDNIFSVNQ